MKQSKQCKLCNKPFITYKVGRFCSQKCYLLGRWGLAKCQNCGKESKIRYCSDQCRKNYWNTHSYHIFKRKYYWVKKFQIIKELGGKCRKCGVEDYRMLDINHIDRKLKGIPKDKRKTYTWTFRIKEWRSNMKNLELLCANCHRLFTWKQMDYGIKSPAKD